VNNLFFKIIKKKKNKNKKSHILIFLKINKQNQMNISIVKFLSLAVILLSCLFANVNGSLIVPLNSTPYDFVKGLYNNCLGRSGSSQEIRGWANPLTAGNFSAARVAHGFFESPEFKSKNVSNSEYVKRLYKALLQRDYDAGGYLNWYIALANGRLTRSQVLDGFVNSPEFQNVCKKFSIDVCV